jgi:hypothetical protein
MAAETWIQAIKHLFSTLLSQETKQWMLIGSVFKYHDILGMAETVQMQGQSPGWILPVRVVCKVWCKQQCIQVRHRLTHHHHQFSVNDA